MISAFVFAVRIVKSLYLLNPKFQASSQVLCLNSPVCVGPGRKHRRPVFSQRGSVVTDRSRTDVSVTVATHFILLVVEYQRTNGPVNTHLISWPSKAQNKQNLENIW